MKSWSVTVLSATSVLKKFSQNHDPEALHGFLIWSYPGTEYHSVYEAGFCGFWIHERLTALGINNIVVNPAEVPTQSSEKLRKTRNHDNWTRKKTSTRQPILSKRERLKSNLKSSMSSASHRARSKACSGGNRTMIAIFYIT